MDAPTSFGEWLRRRRKALDLTQAQLAERAGCSLSALRKIEGGERRPSRQIAELLAQSLEVAPAERAVFVRVARGELSVTRLSHDGRTADPGQASANHVPPRAKSSLPAPTTAFLGRGPEIATLAQLLADPGCRLVTLVGPGGIGKTRLALATAAAQRETFADGAHFVELAPVHSADFVPAAIAAGLGLTLRGPADPLTQLLSFVQDKSLLLVLDNLEHLLSPGASPASGEPVDQLITDMLRRVPGLKLLVTSRERLNLNAEWTFEVQGLPVPPAGAAREMEGSSAVTLFIQSARRARVGFTLADEDGPAVVEICRLVDGMPLGIELAAAWTPVLGCREIAQQIQRSLDFLVSSMRDTPERHNSLRAVFDHSWKLLSVDERQILRGLSVFEGGIPREASEQVAGASVPLMAALVDKSLVRRSGADRYSLHEVIHQYAAAHLAEDPTEQVRAKDRHAAYYLEQAEAAEQGLVGSDQAAWFDRLEQDHDNLRAALASSLAGEGGYSVQRIELALRLAGAITRFWLAQGHLREGRQWLERALALGQTCEPPPPALARAKALGTAGMTARYLGDMRRAEEQLRASLELSRSIGHQLGVAGTLDGLGDVAWAQGDYAGADAYYTAGLAIRRELGDTARTAMALTSLGRSVIDQGDAARAEALFGEALDLQQASGEARGRALSLTGLALVALSRSEYDRAANFLVKSLALLQELGNAVDIAMCVGYLARIALARQQVELAARLWGVQASLLDRLGAPLPHADQITHDRQVAAARARLGHGIFEAAWAQGAALPPEQGIGLAGTFGQRQAEPGEFA